MRLTLGRKLGLGFGVILGLIVVDTTLTYLQANAIEVSQDRAMGVSMPTLETCRNLQKDLNQTQSQGRQVLLAGTETARRESAKKFFNEAWEDIEKDVVRMDELAPQWAVQQNRDLLVEVKKQLPELRKVQEEAMGHAAGSERDATVRAGNEFADHATVIAEAVKQNLADMAASFIALLHENKESLDSDTRLMNLTMGGTAFTAVAIGTFVAIFLSRRISGATQSVLAQAEAIAAGDLTRDEMKIRSEDELGDLANAINKMSGSLKRMILAITENAVQVASASEELNTTSQHITANSEETSAQADVVSKAAQQVSQNLQTVASGAEEMGISIKEIAKNASEAAKVATSAVKVAETTTVIVSKLGESSTEIGQVIKVITSIAQQTNLLALGQGNRQSHRGHQPQDRSHSDRHQSGRRRHCVDQHRDQPDQRYLLHHCHRGRGAERHHQRDVTQRQRSGARQRRDHQQHYRRGGGGAEYNARSQRYPEGVATTSRDIHTTPPPGRAVQDQRQ